MKKLAALLSVIWVGSAYAGPLDQRWWQDDPAQFIVLPRELTAQMPTEWQTQMSDLLDQWNESWGEDLNNLPVTPTVGFRNRSTGLFAQRPSFDFQKD